MTFSSGFKEFMDLNIIEVNVNDQDVLSQPNDVKRFGLKQKEVLSARHGINSDLTPRVYELLCGHDDNYDEEFDAYWCPYRLNENLGVDLAQAADFMFTATMNGCSFGIGSRGANGERRVQHVNRAAVSSQHNIETNFTDFAGAQLRATAVQDAELARTMKIKSSAIISLDFYGGGFTVAGVADGTNVYKPRNNCTTIGVRHASDWSFYTLRYERRSTGYVHWGCLAFPLLV